MGYSYSLDSLYNEDAPVSADGVTMFYVTRFAINSSLNWYRESALPETKTRDAATIALVKYFAEYCEKQDEYNNPVVSIDVMDDIWTLVLANGAAWRFKIVGEPTIHDENGPITGD